MDSPRDLASTDLHTIEPWFAGKLAVVAPLQGLTTQAMRAPVAASITSAMRACRCIATATA